MKDVIISYLKTGCDIFCVWDGCGLWLKLSEFFAFLVFDPFIDLFITLCIAVNVVFMSLDQYSTRYDGM